VEEGVKRKYKGLSPSCGYGLFGVVTDTSDTAKL